MMQGTNLSRGIRKNKVDPHGKLIENATEQQAIALMVRLREGGLSLRAIGTELEGRGITSKSEKAWSAQAVKKILDRADKDREAA
jgi:hypothetical protein